MKIVKLTAENVKRLTAVEIEPTGAVVTVGGKNGAGKSSVLDCIAYALGGQALVPSKPIRKGQAEAEVKLDLGEYLVVRRFKLNDQGVLTSSLTVRSPEGAAYPSPQALLDKLLGKLSFDPLAFAREEPRAQLATLRKLLDLDFTQLEQQRAATYTRRTEANRRVASQRERVKALPSYPGAPVTEVSLDEVSQQLLRAEQARSDAAEVKQRAERSGDEANELQVKLSEVRGREAELKRQLKKLEREATELEQRHAVVQKRHAADRAAAEAASAAVPPTDELTQRLGELEVTNRQVRANQQRAAEAARLTELEQEVDAYTAAIRDADLAKQHALENAEFPVEGLGLTDDGVTLNGLPFEQASTAEQLRVSVAIGLALNPRLKVLLVRSGNDLDADSLHALTEQAAAADAQVWLERVADSREGVTVFIADGAVA